MAELCPPAGRPAASVRSRCVRTRAQGSALPADFGAGSIDSPAAFLPNHNQPTTLNNNQPDMKKALLLAVALCAALTITAKAADAK
ncbi:MAG TPA: hypothetical protein VNT26_17500, partial [Candidatus Sulfotelmatobacter sp.]|nr:hypothetical protein [Candidatus Sulfotelmatobacter sp.]